MKKIKALVTAEVIREKLQERFADQVDFVYDRCVILHGKCIVFLAYLVLRICHVRVRFENVMAFYLKLKGAS